MPTFKNDLSGTDEHAIMGISTGGRGMAGASQTAYGVSGDSQESAGVRGTSVEGRGTEGWSTNTEGVMGISTNGTGVWGQTDGGGTGVTGTSNTGYGVAGESKKSAGVRGTSAGGRGVEGWSTTWEGVVGFSKTSTGVWGQTETGSGVSGTSDSGIGVYGKGGRLAGFFDGNVEVTGDICCTNADCAEDFDIVDPELAEPGTVMVLAGEGELQQSRQPYDTRVAGVISGAGGFRPGIVLDRRPSPPGRKSIALLGKVFCKVDASHGAIEIGDLLTTSPTPGHAMKATDPLRVFGTVIGKALRPLHTGRQLIPILVALQ